MNKEYTSFDIYINKEYTSSNIYFKEKNKKIELRSDIVTPILQLYNLNPHTWRLGWCQLGSLWLGFVLLDYALTLLLPCPKELWLKPHICDPGSLVYQEWHFNKWLVRQLLGNDVMQENQRKFMNLTRRGSNPLLKGVRSLNFQFCFNK
jgi:hypothetical protein